MSRSPDRAAASLARFNASSHALVARLREMPPEAAEHARSADEWSAAQVAWHVALVNDWVSGVLLGSTPGAQPAPAGFKEGFDVRSVPPKLRTVPALEPPQHVSLDAALGRLRTSGQRLMKAIASLTPDRGSNFCVSTMFGTLSLFEVADFAAHHVTRHVAQIDRALAGV
jgi:hypothetical protein